MVWPDERGLSLSGALKEAMARPLVGPPRRPDLVRVADRELAAEIRAVFGAAMKAHVGGVPELNDVLRAMARDLGGVADQRGYLDGDVSADAAAALFFSASEFYRIKPWKVIPADTALRFDIPSRGVHGHCVTVIGSLGKSRGFLLFRSLEGFDSFLDASERPPKLGEPVDLGGSMLSLTFERAAELGVAMRRDAMTHAWPVAGVNAYPVVENRDADGVLRPPSAFDTYLAATCADVLRAFIHRHGNRLRQGLPVPSSEWYISGYSEAWLTTPPDGEPGFVRHSRGPRLSFSLRQIQAPPPPRRRHRPR